MSLVDAEVAKSILKRRENDENDDGGIVSLIRTHTHPIECSSPMNTMVSLNFSSNPFNSYICNCQSVKKKSVMRFNWMKY